MKQKHVNCKKKKKEAYSWSHLSLDMLALGFNLWTFPLKIIQSIYSWTLQSHHHIFRQTSEGVFRRILNINTGHK